MITGDSPKRANGARVCGVQINLPGPGCDENKCNNVCVIQHGGKFKRSAHGYCNPSSQCVCFYACDGTNKCCVNNYWMELNF